MSYGIRKMNQRQKQEQLIRRVVKRQRPLQLWNIEFCLIVILGFDLEQILRLPVIDDLGAGVKDDEIAIAGRDTTPTLPKDRKMEDDGASNERR